MGWVLLAVMVTATFLVAPAWADYRAWKRGDR